MDTSSSDEDSPKLETLNISNDIYYQTIPGFKLLGSRAIDELVDLPKYGSSTIKHSLPAYDLWRPFFPTYLSQEKFRNFHRPKLRHYNTGPQAFRRHTKELPIKSLSRNIYRYQKHLRNRIVNAINNGATRDEIINRVLSIRKAKDLTLKQGEVILFEYSEEYPPVLSQIGMSSNIKIYFKTSDNSSVGSSTKPKPISATTSIKVNASSSDPSGPGQTKTNDKGPTELNTNCSYGKKEVISDKLNKSLYYCQLKPGSETQFIENNLYRAPIYQHQVPTTDFLVIRTRNSIYIRGVQSIFLVGQTMPLMLVPKPNDNAISKFRQDLSNAYIHKLFSENECDPPEINLDYLARLFPDYDVKALRRRMIIQGVRAVDSSNFSRGTSKYGLISKNECRKILTPEQYCLNMSMLAARQRLRELNYSESMILATNQNELEAEVLAAPWNTSKAAHDLIAGRCYLDLRKHLIDPTGSQREGFSCVSWSKSPTEDEQKSQRDQPVKTVSQPITFQAINPLAMKIKREKLERLAIYQKEAQHIFRTQSEVLSSKEVLSSDEGSDGQEEDDETALDKSFDQQLKDLDKLVVNGRSRNELDFENEEEERLDLMKTLLQNSPLTNKNSSQVEINQNNETSSYKNKVLRIIRTYKSDNGEEIHRTELVRDPKVISLYVKQKAESISSVQENMRSDQQTMLTPESTASPLPLGNCSSQSYRRDSLGPTELCRADGTILRISKSVLNSRALRRHQRLNRSRRNSESSFFV